ncbi:PAS domain-containing sensor histidine kinase [Neisseria sp. ZJ106]|uniref:histidine kinase n=1 Tax=Neisseria lisongii TaxID=2912188 RepID=A0AAW5AQT4_9NEIS|nr:PAS domain-containing sensor histidine kinase [Neisseria lisongii]MCF7522085.1 PAS domain-containing sensor histidine kinase [Neisseria lisongii]MCF7530552.1 PAS domain-containing sensor histidine kinase [Neisseria lisongii]WCL71371.1 PAS domain-containing sensor histidine kinase [Neisseria lisongii]
MRRFLLIAAVLAVALLAGLTVATGSTSRLADYFWWIIALSALLMLVLAAVLVRSVVLLMKDSRRGVFGSRIARRLSGMFTLVAVLPGVFLFGISAQFINGTINSWFGNDTQEALERSLNLSKSALNLAVDNAVSNAAPVQIDLISAASLNHDLAETLNKSADLHEFQQLVLYNISSGKIEADLNPHRFAKPSLTAAQHESLQEFGSVRSLENIGGTFYAQGWLSVGFYQNQEYALFFRQAVPADVAQDATLIEAAKVKYATLSYTKKGLQTFFLVTLLVATLMAIFLALVMALYFARRFVAPVLSLAEGAKAVAQGDFSRQSPVLRNDEFGRLTQLFNHMTEQLAIAKAADERNRLQQEAARHYLECVLESLTTGVITLDAQGRLKTFNKAAERILGVSLVPLWGSNWHDWRGASPQQTLLADVFAAIEATAEAAKPVQVEYAAPDDARILLGKATILPEDNDNGVVMVIDDITVLIRAQKEAAWGEVAKRLAHEIRNPLTPIQLAAERLAWKLNDKLDEQHAQILTRSTDTIVKQVAALKEMVEAFRNYARAPSLNFEKHDLNRLVEEVLLLYEGGSCTFSAKFSNMALWISADTTAMRQVLHNLFKNAAEAAQSDERPQVDVAVLQENGQVVLSVCNNGKSFSKEMLHNAFEPYVTDKPTGTGLGLPVVKKIIEEHGGRISLSNLNAGGACVKIALPNMVETYAQQ